jgi:hypothetical protein
LPLKFVLNHFTGGFSWEIIEHDEVNFALFFSIRSFSEPIATSSQAYSVVVLSFSSILISFRVRFFFFLRKSKRSKKMRNYYIIVCFELVHCSKRYRKFNLYFASGISEFEIFNSRSIFNSLWLCKLRARMPLPRVWTWYSIQITGNTFDWDMIFFFSYFDITDFVL